MGFLQKAFVGLFGLSIFSGGAGWAYVLLSTSVADGTGGWMTKGFFVPLALFVALSGLWLMSLALKGSKSAA